MEDLIKQVFVRSDTSLCAEEVFGDRFRGRPVPSELVIFVGPGRCGLGSQPGYLDPVALSYLSGYARWFYSPSFMLRALQNGKITGESEQFLNIFRFCADILDEHGLEDGSDIKEVPADALEALDVKEALARMSIDECMEWNSPAPHPSTFEYFCRSACHFSACERKVVEMFLAWMMERNPYDLGASLALKCFWRS